MWRQFGVHCTRCTHCAHCTLHALAMLLGLKRWSCWRNGLLGSGLRAEREITELPDLVGLHGYEFKMI